MITAANIQYQLADRVHGLGPGGLGAMLLLARKVGLISAIDNRLHVLKRHLPYHESDHVLNIAFNILAGGECIEHLEPRRNDEVYLDALGAQRIPDPTTAGDFCRRFTEPDIVDLMDAANETRLGVWSQQPAEFFDQAVLDVDGALVATDAECKEGVGLSYNGVWGFHPLLISLANTAEPLFLVNRPGNRPSHDQAAGHLDRAIDLCRRAGFRRILMRGDTDFSQTAHLDAWDDAGDVHFVFGMDASPKLKGIAEDLPDSAYRLLERPKRDVVKTSPRTKPARVKEQIVRERGYKNLHVVEEHVAEFRYRPVACNRDYRVIVLRKRVVTDQNQMRIFDEYRYFSTSPTSSTRGGLRRRRSCSRPTAAATKRI